MASERAKKTYLTGTTSLYLTAAELAMRGFVVSVTARNAPGVDLQATSETMRTIGIQVKGNHWDSPSQSFWLLSERAKHASDPSLFYVFVNLRPPGTRPDFYVVPSGVVASELEVDRRQTGSTWYTFSRDTRFLEKWELLAEAPT